MTHPGWSGAITLFGVLYDGLGQPACHLIVNQALFLLLYVGFNQSQAARPIEKEITARPILIALVYSAFDLAAVIFLCCCNKSSVAARSSG